MMGVADLGLGGAVFIEEMTESGGSSTRETFVVPTTHKTLLPKGIELIPVLRKTKYISSKNRYDRKAKAGGRSTRIKRGQPRKTNGTVDHESGRVNEQGDVHKADSRQLSVLTDDVMTSKQSPLVSPNESINSAAVSSVLNSSGNNGVSSNHHFSLPLWIDPSQGLTLSPDLFQPCYDSIEEIDYPTPSTNTEKEFRRNARLKQLDSMKKIEQSEQRRNRFLKRQKRLDVDDGIPTIEDTNNLTVSPPKSKKKVMWQEDSDLFELFVYSPVALVADREVTPIIS